MAPFHLEWVTPERAERLRIMTDATRPAMAGIVMYKLIATKDGGAQQQSRLRSTGRSPAWP